MGNITASFTLAPNLQVAGVPVIFSGIADTDAEGGSITQWEWKFDSEDIMVGTQVQEHTFLDPGNYAVRMRVTDNENDQAIVGPIAVQIKKRYRVSLAWAERPHRIRVTTTEYAAGDRPTNNRWYTVQGVMNIAEQYDKCADRLWDRIEEDPDPPNAADIRAGIEAELQALYKESLS